MRRGLPAFLVVWLVACTPVYLGSVPYYPYNLDDFPVFTSPAGLPLFGRQRYEERRWTALVRGSTGSLGLIITLEFGQPTRPISPFPNPVDRCRFGGEDERPASAVRLVLLEAPPGFGVGLEKASYKLSCGRLERDPRGFELLRYTTWLEVLYRFEIPPVDPGVYMLRWQLWEGERLVAEEDRRFTLMQRR